MAARLEKISQEIMQMVPDLMDEPLKIMRGGNLSYEQFSVAARRLTFDHQIVGWSKVALLCHFAREVAIMGELDDSQLEMLAEHSFRFIQESTEEWIEKKGGWVSIERNCAVILISLNTNSHIVSNNIEMELQCSPYQAVTGKICRHKQQQATVLTS